MTIDLTKPVRAKNGNAVRIICTDMKNEQYPVVAIVTNGEGYENVCTFTLDGLEVVGYEQDQSNLENLPEMKYKLVYEDAYIVPQGRWLDSKEQFDHARYEVVGRVGYLVKTGEGWVYEPIV